MSSKNEKIKAILILEVIGRPAEYLTETLDNMIKQIGEEPNVYVREHKVNEPCELKEQKDFYTTFAEIEVEVNDLLSLSGLMFKYMPAHVEIIEPESIFSTNNDWNTIFNELIRRLHGYDEIARMIEIEKNILEKKLRDVLEGKIKQIKIEENIKENIPKEEIEDKNIKTEKPKKQKRIKKE